MLGLLIPASRPFPRVCARGLLYDGGVLRPKTYNLKPITYNPGVGGGRDLLAGPLLTVRWMHRSRRVRGGLLPLHDDAQHAGLEVDVPFRDAGQYEL